MDTGRGSLNFSSGYSAVNGLKMYYEVYGQGKPLVLIHGGGSTIQSNFGKVIPLFAKNRKVLAMELQAHGRTGDRSGDFSFEQDADDVAALLRNLNIGKADFFGFSNGGTTTLQIAIRHPEIVNKIILGSALVRRNGMPDQFWEFMKQSGPENMPGLLKEAYLQVSPDPKGFERMFFGDAGRMIDFRDIADEKVSSVNAPALVINGDKDIILTAHAIELQGLIPGSELMIIPGGHGEYIGEITTLKPGHRQYEHIVPLIEQFLDK